MNIEKIEINGHYVWVDKDAEIKEGDWVLSGNKTYKIKESAKDFLEHVKTISKKIIAASPELNLEGVENFEKYLEMSK